MKRRLAAALAAAVLLVAPAALAFNTNDPLAPRQWYLRADHAFDFWPPPPPTLTPVRVAVVDSGIDGGHPELAGRIVAAKSFVAGSPLVDVDGHGTFVAGEIAATLNNGQGIAGIAFPAQLLVAKAVGKNGVAPLRAETAAIRWAVAQGARVINISLAGLRDPRHRSRDTYSAAERRAVDFATRHGVLVVAAAGNGDDAPSQPWPYASYPAALPHVLGVAAYGPSGDVPAFSNRYAVYDDLAAPGQAMLSTFPRALTARNRGCREQGYSSCGPPGYQRGDGTSFSAPQVTAAAALLFALHPALRADQARTILERTAVDATALNGCSACAPGRDRLTGWGKLDVAAALRAVSRPLPPADRLEPNDALSLARPLPRGLSATLDFWDDARDVYSVRLRRGQALVVHVSGSPARLALRRRSGRVVARGTAVLTFRPRAGGVYFLNVRATPASGAYTVTR